MNSRRCMSFPKLRDGILTPQTSTLIGAETGIKTIAAVHSQCRRWVKDRRTRRERKSSAAFSITDDLLHRNILLLRASSGLVQRSKMLYSMTSSASAR